MGFAKTVGGGVDGHAPDRRGCHLGAKGLAGATRAQDKPVSNPAPPPQKREYDSKWEETYASELVLRKHAGLIRNYYYHPFSMWLPGKVRYTPDFMIEYPLGMERKLEIVEVKGWSKNLRDGMTRLKIAAAIFDCYTWKLVKKRKGGGWDEVEL